MPVFCIGYGCDNHQRSASSEVSFHRLPLKKPALLKQVRIFSVNCVFQNAPHSYHRQIVAKEDEAGRSTHL